MADLPSRRGKALVYSIANSGIDLTRAIIFDAYDQFKRLKSVYCPHLFKAITQTLVGLGHGLLCTKIQRDHDSTHEDPRLLRAACSAAKISSGCIYLNRKPETHIGNGSGIPNMALRSNGSTSPLKPSTTFSHIPQTTEYFEDF